MYALLCGTLRKITLSLINLKFKMLPQKPQIGMTFLTQKIYDALGKLSQCYQSSDIFVTFFNVSISPSVFNHALMWLKPVLLLITNKKTLPSQTQFVRASDSHIISMKQYF